MRFVPLFALAGLCGCGPDGPPVYPVSGRLELPAGDVSRLAGSAVEAAADADPGVRASGEIQPDGTFRLQSLAGGEVRGGVPAGSYRVRIVPNAEDDATRRQAATAVAPRFLRFDQSRLSLQVPPPGEVVLAVSPR